MRLCEQREAGAVATIDGALADTPEGLDAGLDHALGCLRQHRQQICEDALQQAKTVLREHRATSPGADPKVLAAAIEDTQVYREQVMRASTM